MAWFDDYVEYRDVWITEHTKRRMREWRRGSAVTINAADRLMVELGEHLGDLPDDVWTDPPDRRPMRTQPVTTAQRLEAVARVRAGAAKSRIAAEYRVGRHTLCRWLRIYP